MERQETRSQAQVATEGAVCQRWRESYLFVVGFGGPLFKTTCSVEQCNHEMFIFSSWYEIKELLNSIVFVRFPHVWRGMVNWIDCLAISAMDSDSSLLHVSDRGEAASLEGYFL